MSECYGELIFLIVRYCMGVLCIYIVYKLDYEI